MKPPRDINADEGNARKRIKAAPIDQFPLPRQAPAGKNGKKNTKDIDHEMVFSNNETQPEFGRQSRQNAERFAQMYVFIRAEAQGKGGDIS